MLLMGKAVNIYDSSKESGSSGPASSNPWGRRVSLTQRIKVRNVVRHPGAESPVGSAVEKAQGGDAGPEIHAPCRALGPFCVVTSPWASKFPGNGNQQEYESGDQVAANDLGPSLTNLSCSILLDHEQMCDLP